MRAGLARTLGADCMQGEHASANGPFPAASALRAASRTGLRGLPVGTISTWGMRPAMQRHVREPGARTRAHSAHTPRHACSPAARLAHRAAALLCAAARHHAAAVPGRALPPREPGLDEPGLGAQARARMRCCWCSRWARCARGPCRPCCARHSRRCGPAACCASATTACTTSPSCGALAQRGTRALPAWP